MRDKETPLPLVRKWDKMAPGCYEALDRCRNAKDTGAMSWPDWCELPISAAYTYLVCNLNLTEQEAAMIASELTACWIWRRNKIIYAFDGDLMDALAAQAEDMTETDVLPTDLLMHLPYPCIYIKAPICEDCDGFWAWMEYDQNRPDQPELRIQYMVSTMLNSVGVVLHLIPGGTLRDCINSTCAVTSDAKTDVVPKDIRLILTAIQLLLYLVSAQADVEEQPAPVRPVRQGKRAAIVQDKASEIKAMDVGIRIGAALRAGKSARSAVASASGGSGSSKRPHARRGHWHHYWTGPQQDRKLILKWTPPTFIHPDAGAGDNIVMFPVKGKRGE